MTLPQSLVHGSGKQQNGVRVANDLIRHLGDDLLGNRQTAVLYARADGFISFWNEGAAALFGHSAKDVAGKRIDVIVPPELRDMHWAGFNRTMGSNWRGSEGWGPIEALHQNGSRIALEVFLTPVQGEGQGVTGVMALFRPAAI